VESVEVFLLVVGCGVEVEGVIGSTNEIKILKTHIFILFNSTLV